VRVNPDVPQTCEATCPLFQKLGELVRRVVLLDPMLCSREHVLKHLAHEPPATKPRGDDLPLRRHGSEVAHLVAAHCST
jgi:hypothetical protein